MLIEFEKYASKGQEFLHRLEANLGIKDQSHASLILRSTLRVLRNHLSFTESLNLLAQLPMAIKGIYVDGWQVNQHKKIHTVDEFVAEIIMEEGNSAWRDFSNKDEVLEAVRAVLKTMESYVSRQEMDQAMKTLPKNLMYNLWV